ncbi:major allergen pru ar 1 [Phtheirospermum japonicum]|uniref:Major allergen pru ar 1 n=1 Tax=Phtheirospermum japonicum TaxID=374723 RepID=A0A830B6Y6_9LAMI|nr:major allergen pru ar 1 [Phtheirospermum japonicum]
MFKAMVVEPYTVLPKIMSGAIKSVDLLHGNGGPGTIMQTNFSDGSPAPYLKHRVDAIDTENCTTKYSLIEGGWLDDKLESIDFDVKFVESGDGGCVIKINGEYHTKGDAILKDDDIKAGKEKAKGFYIAADEYLFANPNVCA